MPPHSVGLVPTYESRSVYSDVFTPFFTQFDIHLFPYALCLCAIPLFPLHEREARQNSLCCMPKLCVKNLAGDSSDLKTAELNLGCAGCACESEGREEVSAQQLAKYQTHGS